MPRPKRTTINLDALQRTEDTERAMTPKVFDPTAPVKRRGVSGQVMAKRAEKEERRLEEAMRPAGVRARRRRTPLDAHQLSLTVHNKNPDYEYHWFVDRDERIKNAYDNDWDFVVNSKDGTQAISDDPGTALSQVANKTAGGQRLYLMAKPKEYFQEDQRQKRARLNAVDEAIFRNQRTQSAPRAEDNPDGHFYHPTSSPTQMVKGE